MTDRTTPPSDAAMGKVVAEWMGWDDFIGSENGGLFGHDPKEPYETAWVADPRTNTDAALELLGWLMDEMERLDGNSRYLIKRDAEWQLHEHSPIYMDHIIPISGEPFRTAICWLAVDVLGVEHD